MFAVDSSMKATALHAAAYLRHPEVMKILIEYGIDIDAQGPLQRIHCLTMQFCRTILKGQAPSKCRCPVGHQKAEGDTPLDLAKKVGIKIVAILSGRNLID